MDYKKLIGLEVRIKSSRLHAEVVGVLIAVVADVLVVQSSTCWGILISDITYFDVNSLLRYERYAK